MTGSGGVEIDVGPGDVIVVPAGVSHFSISSEDDYRYTGVYPEVREVSGARTYRLTLLGRSKMAKRSLQGKGLHRGPEG